jgi:hypothetical protein
MKYKLRAPFQTGSAANCPVIDGVCYVDTREQVADLCQAPHGFKFLEETDERPEPKPELPKDSEPEGKAASGETGSNLELQTNAIGNPEAIIGESQTEQGSAGSIQLDPTPEVEPLVGADAERSETEIIETDPVTKAVEQAAAISAEQPGETSVKTSSESPQSAKNARKKKG